MKHIKLKFWRVKNVVFMRVIEQTGIERGDFRWHCDNTATSINSEDRPELLENAVCVRGVEWEYDNLITTIEFETVECAKEYVEKVIKTVNILNNEFADEESTEDDEIETFVVG